MTSVAMTLREATVEDVPPVAALETLLFGADAWSAAQVAEELAGERRRAWVVGDPVVGYAVTMRTGDVVDLQRIGVHPADRGRGLARQLLDAAVAAAAEARADRMLLEVAEDNTPALELYSGAGFVEIDRRRRYYRDGGDAVVMRLLLAAAPADGEDG